MGVLLFQFKTFQFEQFPILRNKQNPLWVRFAILKIVAEFLSKDNSMLVRGYSRKCIFLSFFLLNFVFFIQIMCKNNDCGCDFSHGRCLFYQEEYILIFLKNCFKFCFRNLHKIQQKCSKYSNLKKNKYDYLGHV